MFTYKPQYFQGPHKKSTVYPGNLRTPIAAVLREKLILISIILVKALVA